MKTGLNLTKILTKELEEKWVALTPDYKKVVAASADLASLEEKVGDKKVVYMKVMPSDREFAFLENETQVG